MDVEANKVVIQLRLKVLGNFKQTTDKQNLETSVSSYDGMVRLWMEIRLLNKAGEPTKAIPLKDGLVEMQLPTKFFEGNLKSFKMKWIDFYRN